MAEALTCSFCQEIAFFATKWLACQGTALYKSLMMCNEAVRMTGRGTLLIIREYIDAIYMRYEAFKPQDSFLRQQALCIGYTCGDGDSHSSSPSQLSRQRRGLSIDVFIALILL